MNVNLLHQRHRSGNWRAVPEVAHIEMPIKPVAPIWQTYKPAMVQLTAIDGARVKMLLPAIAQKPRHHHSTTRCSLTGKA